MFVNRTVSTNEIIIIFTINVAQPKETAPGQQRAVNTERTKSHTLNRCGKLKTTKSVFVNSAVSPAEMIIIHNQSCTTQQTAPGQQTIVNTERTNSQTLNRCGK
jgi:hypothetical protein